MVSHKDATVLLQGLCDCCKAEYTRALASTNILRGNQQFYFQQSEIFAYRPNFSVFSSAMGPHQSILLLQILPFHNPLHSSLLSRFLCSWQQLQRKLKALFPDYVQTWRPVSENPVLKASVFIVFCASLPRSPCCGKILPSVRYIKLDIFQCVGT